MLTAGSITTAVLLGLPTGPAQAVPTLTLYRVVVSPDHGVPGAAVSLTISPATLLGVCNADAYQVLVSYVDSAGVPKSRTVTGTTPTEIGTFTVQTVIPLEARPSTGTVPSSVAYAFSVPRCSGNDNLDGDPAAGNPVTVKVDAVATASAMPTPTPSTAKATVTPAAVKPAAPAVPVQRTARFTG